MLTEFEITRLKDWSSKFFKDADKDELVFDIESNIDKTLNFQEAKNELRKRITAIIPIYNEKSIAKMKRKEAEIISKEAHEVLVNNEIQKEEKQAQLEFEKALKKIGDDKTTQVLEDYYYIPKKFAKMVATGFSRGFLLWGESGTGKSHSVIQSFREAEKPFVYLSGHITSLELFQYLYAHRTENVILDDINLFENEINLNMLKSALGDLKKVSYNTSSSKLRAPDYFTFEGTITILMNNKPKNNESLKAVESRILNYEFKLNYEDKIKILLELSKQEYKGLTEQDRKDIFLWIKENTNKATKNFNLRTLFHLYSFYLFDKENWKKLAEKIIVNDEEFDLIIKGMNSQEWCEKIGKSRATYFRYKNSIR